MTHLLETKGWPRGGDISPNSLTNHLGQVLLRAQGEIPEAAYRGTAVPSLSHTLRWHPATLGGVGVRLLGLPGMCREAQAEW